MTKKKKKKIIIFSSVAILIVILFFTFSKKDKTEYVTIDLKKQDLVQTVSEIGAVKASKELNLNFLQIGRLNNLNVAVGDQVESEQVLAELDYSSLLIRRDEVSASLNIAKANMDKIVKGATNDELRIAENQVSQAKISYESAQQDLFQVEKIVAENISQAEKNLRDLKLSNSEAPMSIKQSVESAKLNLENTKRTSQQTIDNSYNSLSSSLDYNLSVGRSALDAVKRIIDDENIENVFSVKNSFYKTETENSYDRAIKMVDVVKVDIEYFKQSYSRESASKASDSLSLFLDEVFDVLNNCFNALENTIISSSFSQVTLDSFKSSISSNTGFVNSAISSNIASFSALNNAILSYSTSVSNAQDAVSKAEIALSDAILNAENSLSLLRISSEQQINSAKAKLDSTYKSYDLYKLQLNKLKSPARSEDIRLAQAQIDQANSSLESIDKQIEDHKLKSPIKGKVVKINYEIGEQVTGGTPMIVLLTENDFEIELLVSESDISKLKIGNQAEISFDAFDPDYKIYGELYFIEPAATSISGVIYYKTKIIFSGEQLTRDNLTVKSGMTANVDIISDKKENVLVVPFRAIINDNERRFVRVLDDNEKVREVDVEVGITGDQAMVEITSDKLKEGDKIITTIRSVK
jgi:HlyD family secretion protein